MTKAKQSSAAQIHVGNLEDMGTHFASAWNRAAKGDRVNETHVTFLDLETMSFKGYTASMVFDVQDKIIVGRVLDIDDIISFHGESVAEFESNFHAVIEDYLAASKELGSAPEKPASGKVMLRIAPARRQRMARDRLRQAMERAGKHATAQGMNGELLDQLLADES